MVLAETEKAAESVIEAFMGLKANILIREFIAEAGGADIRCLVVGGKVVGAMKRQSRTVSSGSNLHRGGSASLIKAHPGGTLYRGACRRHHGIECMRCGHLRANHGPVVMEVNSSPGLEGIEGATQRDVAGMIVQFIERNHQPHKTKTRQGLKKMNKRQAFPIGGQLVAAATRRSVNLTLPGLPTTRYPCRYVKLHGRHDGPVVLSQCRRARRRDQWRGDHPSTAG